MRKFIFIFLAIMCPLLAYSDTCVPSNNSCEFYECKENEFQCGSKGYWMSFGKPFCQKFLDHEQSFSDSSRNWLQDVRLCLQERVAETASTISCKKIHKFAMHSHVSCYVDTGFCDLSFTEQFVVYWHLKSALSDIETWREAHLLRRACANRS